MSNADRQNWIENAKEQIMADTKESDKVTRELLQLYDEAAYKIEQSIHALYGKFATDNGLSMMEATALLSGSDYTKWRNSLSGYLDMIKQNPDSKTLIELNTLAMKSRITRQEALLGDVYKNLAVLAGDCSTKLDSLLGDVIKVNYNKSAYLLQKGLQVAFPVPHINERAIRHILNYPWHTKKFSKAVWDNIDRITTVAKHEIAAGIMTGSSCQRITKNVAELMGKGKDVAERLVRTERQYFAYQAKLKAWEESGIEHYRFIGAEETSKCHCGELNGAVHKLEEAVVGVNYPPIHPNCRCSAVAYIHEGVFSPKYAQPMPKDMKFEDWSKEYLSKDKKVGDINLESIPITNKAINAVKPVPSKLLDKQGQKLLAQRNKELLKYVKDEPPGTEAIAYYDMSMKELAKAKGGYGHVGGFRVATKHIITHNHPSGGTFTHTDLTSFVENTDTAMLVAIGNNGKVYTLEKGNDYDGFEISRLLAPILEKYNKKGYNIDTYMADINNFLKEVGKYGASYEG